MAHPLLLLRARETKPLWLHGAAARGRCQCPSTRQDAGLSAAGAGPPARAGGQNGKQSESCGDWDCLQEETQSGCLFWGAQGWRKRGEASTWGSNEPWRGTPAVTPAVTPAAFPEASTKKQRAGVHGAQSTHRESSCTAAPAAVPSQAQVCVRPQGRDPARGHPRAVHEAGWPQGQLGQRARGTAPR